ncbi:transcriptional regulator, LysR family [Serinicoccus hydrothermalis]|uniref:Transcriptional regulator, LysR family n=1 Tax=Serinicoccus hydrothermalis TaxID=1758689 RepID=A0A1B1NDM7_9MICO|nr:LysR substrate-binding domain-containing protein [Serinicoccus hydrothermalis]ANS79550.1 transcriptional regulator, LysR family [Serinicoccus hydrothermalis]
MDVAALRWFQLVADGVTVTEVSEIEMVSQPAVSRALARLEKEVGAPLLRREGRVLRMTHAGTVFKRHVDAVLHQLDDGLAAVQQLLDPETGTVTVAFQPSLGTWLVPDLVTSFRAAHPHVRLDLRSKEDETVTAVGQQSEVDLELSTLRPHPGEDQPRWRALVAEPLRLLVGPDHRLVGRTEAELAEVAQDPFVAMVPTSVLRKHTDQLCREAGFVPEIAFVAADLPTLRGYAAAGLGVAVAPTRWGGSVAAPVAGLHVLALSDRTATRDVGLSWAPGRRLLPAAELFRRHVLDRAEAGLLPHPVPPTET